MVLLFELNFSAYLNKFFIKFNKLKQFWLLKNCCKTRITYSVWPQNIESRKNMEFENSDR